MNLTSSGSGPLPKVETSGLASKVCKLPRILSKLNSNKKAHLAPADLKGAGKETQFMTKLK